MPFRLVAFLICSSLLLGCTEPSVTRVKLKRGPESSPARSGAWSLVSFRPGATAPLWIHGSTAGIVAPHTFRTRVLLEQPDGETVACVRQLGSGKRWVVVSASGSTSLYSDQGKQLAHLKPPKGRAVGASCFGYESEDGEGYLFGTDAHYRVVVTPHALHPIETSEPTGNFGWLSSSESFYVNDGDIARVYERKGDEIRPVGTTRSLYPDTAHKKGWLISREPEGKSTLWKLPELEKKETLPGGEAEFVSDIIVTSEKNVVRGFDLDGKLLWTKREGPVLPRRSPQPTNYVLVSSTAPEGGPGYALLDPRTGRRIRAFRYSGYKCSYATVQRGSIFAMLEGGLVSFQTPRGGHTVETNCAGTHDALFFRRGARGLIFDTVFDWIAQEPGAQLETPEGWHLYPGFRMSQDESYILGALDSFEYPHPRRPALWDPDTGKLIRQLELDDFELSPGVEYPGAHSLSLHGKARAVWGVYNPKSSSLVWWMGFVRKNGKSSESRFIRLEPGCSVESLPSEFRDLVDPKELSSICEFLVP